MPQEKTPSGLHFDQGLDRAALGLLALAALLLAVCVADAGITFDEPECAANGRRILRFWSEGCSFYDAGAADLMRFYGGAFDMPCAVAERLLPFPAHHVRHACTAIAALLLAFGTWRLGRVAGGSMTGLAALLLLLATPGFWAHAANNPKDIPFAAGAAWSLLLMLSAVPRMPALCTGRALLLGAVLGATSGIRIGGLLFVGLAGLLLAACTIAEMRHGGRGRATLIAALRTAVLMLLAFLVVLFGVWPWIWSAPFERIREAMDTMAHFPWPDTLLYEGQALRLSEVPQTYLPVMLSATAPVGLAAVWSVAVALAGFTQARLAALLCAFAVAIPVGSILLGHGQLYDGLRHLLFVVPALAVIAGLGIASMSRALPQRWNLAVLMLAVTAVLWHVPALARLHPYEVAWFSESSGGLAAAEGRFDTDYWLASYREAAEWLAATATAPSPRHADGRHRVKVALRSATVTPFLPAERFVIVDDGSTADWFIASTRWQAHERHPGEVVHRISRSGVAFCIVKSLPPH